MTPIKAEIQMDNVVIIEKIVKAKKWILELMETAKSRTGMEVVGIVIDGDTAHLLSEGEGSYWVLVDNFENGILPVKQLPQVSDDDVFRIEVNWFGTTGKQYPVIRAEEIAEKGRISKTVLEEFVNKVAITGSSSNEIMGAFCPEFFPLLELKLRKVTNQDKEQTAR